MQSEFEFAFADSDAAEISTLNFISSIKDKEGNNIAYVDSDLKDTYFENSESQNMWIRQSGEVSGPVLVDLSAAITQDVIDFVNKITTRIHVTVGQEEREPVVEENTTITTTVGYLQIEPQEGYTYEYQLIESLDEDYTRFVTLAKEISSYTDSESSYENISKINEFYNLYNSLYDNLISEDWNEVVDNKIEQSEDARNGEECVVWIKAANSNGEEIVDVQFMTSVREETEQTSTETIKEEVTTTTKLPVTFDSNIILVIVFAVIIVAIIVLLVIKKKISKK